MSGKELLHHKLFQSFTVIYNSGCSVTIVNHCETYMLLSDCAMQIGPILVLLGFVLNMAVQT